ncbi:S1 family peptidase [Streptomyces spinoverrucosus]|uniref:trypsin-like serine protease n=1 Tax=Streptomyces spinoverrucosus TaxID=284043 RepID=UPI0018C3FB79|nr:trypsin-like serine protease [Streptomyces spinoverrucosus]MBG0852986.1 S1 family peptidase [Streptomyces spinoverrucosus]
MITPQARPVRLVTLAAAALLATPLVLTAAPAHAVSGTAASGTTYRSTARLDIGDGTRACSGTLVHAEWLLTAASCFADNPAADLTVPAGAPKLPTTATIGRSDLTTTAGQVVNVVELVPRTDRDLVLARLSRPVTTATPVALATTAPTAGEQLTAAGYGRTKTEWAPLKLHSGAFSVDSADATTATVTGQDGAAICAGDAGGPVLRVTSGQATLAAVNSRSWQGGCFGTDASETRTGGVATRVDDLRDWVAAKVGATRVTDFNCDGAEDVVGSDPKASVAGLSEAGLLKVVYGAGKGNETLHQNLDYVPGGAEADDEFGSELAVVDYDEDGCSDLVVGVPFEDVGTEVDAGLVTVLYGAPQGLGQGKAGFNLQQGTGTGAIDARASEAGDRMGAALAAGRTATGEPYLLIGAPGKDLKGYVDAGIAYYVRGSVNVDIHQDSPGVVGVMSAGDEFGATAAGSPSHIAIGSPGETVGTSADAGMVAILKHELSADGIPTPVASVNQDTDGISDGSEGGDLFGSSLSMVAYRPSGATAATDSILAVGTPGETLWVGTNSFPQAGQVTTLRITAAGAVSQLATIHQGVEGVNGASTAGDGFGTQVVAANTAPNATGTAETMLLAVGVPGKDVGTATDAGIVQTFSLLGAPGDSDHWIEAGNERGLPGTPGASQLVGKYLNATGTHLWIGMPHGPAERGAIHGLPWSDAMGATGGTVITHQPGLNGMAPTGKAFGMAIR